MNVDATVCRRRKYISYCTCDELLHTRVFISAIKARCTTNDHRNVSQYAYVTPIVRQIPKHTLRVLYSLNKCLQYLINGYTFLPTLIKTAQLSFYADIVLATLHHDYRSDYPPVNTACSPFFPPSPPYILRYDSRPRCGNRESCAVVI